MKPRTAALSAAVIIIGGFGAMRAKSHHAGGPATPAPNAAMETAAVPVETLAIGRGTINRTLFVTGTLKTDRDVHITSKIAGKVAAIYTKEGDRVRAGQLLLALDDADQRAQVQQASAALRAAAERLSQAEAGRKVRYAQTDAGIEQAAANLRSAQLRVKQLEASARMTDTSSKSSVAQAEANLAAAKDQLRIVTTGARSQERRVADNAVEQALANLETAKSHAQRRRALFAQGAISQEDLDDSEKQLKLAQSQYNSATEQRDLIQEGSRTEEVRIAEQQVRQAEEALRTAKSSLERTSVSEDDVASAKATVAQMEAALHVAKANTATYKIVPSEIAAARAAEMQASAQLTYTQEQLRNTRIYSPVDGVVATRSTNVGESIGTATQLMNVVAINGVYFEAQVPELSLSSVRVGMPVSVTVDSLPGRKLQGTVRELIPVAATSSKNFRVRVAVANGGQLPVGAFARGEVALGKDAAALLVPKDCLVTLVGEDYVYLAVDGKAKQQPVKVGDSDKVNAQILSGLKEGDRIISSGTAMLSDGVKIKIVGGKG